MPNARLREESSVENTIELCRYAVASVAGGSSVALALSECVAAALFLGDHFSRILQLRLRLCDAEISCEF